MIMAMTFFPCCAYSAIVPPAPMTKSSEWALKTMTVSFFFLSFFINKGISLFFKKLFVLTVFTQTFINSSLLYLKVPIWQKQIVIDYEYIHKIHVANSVSQEYQAVKMH